jgi:hypothetical protein
MSISSLLSEARKGGVEILNDDGKIVGYVLPPDDDEAWAYAEASMDIQQHRDEILTAMERRTGVTTRELLQNLERAGKLHDLERAFDVLRELITEKKNELGALGVHDKSAVPMTKVG